MKNDLEDYLSLELKREMAERYFGFRKMIEDDTLDLTEKIESQLAILEQRISYELIRIYILLKDEELIQQFMELTGWSDDPATGAEHRHQDGRARVALGQHQSRPVRVGLYVFPGLLELLF